MSTRLHRLHRQAGSMLLEALIAILVFSLGILSIIGMQATSIKLSGDAKYRADASLLANQLISQMWVDDRTNIATLQSKYNSPNGTAYTAWLGNTTNDGTVLKLLPGATATVTVVPVSGVTTNSSLVTVTLSWTAQNQPGAASSVHTYKTIAQIL
ncbi:MAG: pilus assembly protein PilV [Pseudomonadota bacterium]